MKRALLTHRKEDPGCSYECTASLALFHFSLLFLHNFLLKIMGYQLSFFFISHF